MAGRIVMLKNSRRNVRFLNENSRNAESTKSRLRCRKGNKMLFYQLLHCYDVDDSTKDLGYYTSLDEVYRRIEIYKTAAGFREYPDGFIIVPLQSPVVEPDKPFYEAGIWNHTMDFEMEDYISLGYFAQEEEARHALDCFNALNQTTIPGVVKETYIAKHVLNRAEWTEGF